MTLPLTDSQGTPTDIAVSALDDPEAAPSVAPVPSEDGGASTLTGPKEADDGQEIEDIAVLTDPLAVDDDFLVAGVTWDVSQSLSEENEIYLRVREGDTWSDWTPMGSDGSGRDDGVGLSGTEPFLTGGADAMQIEVTGDSAALPADLSVSMIPANPQGETTLDSSDVNPTEAEPTPLAPAEEHEEENEQGNSPAQSGPTNDEGASDTTSQSGTPSSQGAPNSGTGGSVGSGGSAVINSRALLAATSSSNTLPVDVITRSEWGANESYMTWTPEEANAPFVIVHHTVGTNSYSASQSASIVNGIYYYHAVTLGWGDIGYNFLVDKYGQVFEGRAGSAEASAGKMVAGAHAQGANTGTMGIAMMGTYTSESPTSAELTSVGKMAGWQLSRAGVDPTGSATFTITYSNGKYNKGDKVTLNRIAGHRDVYATECPGNVGYTKLGMIRSIASTVQADDSSGSANVPQGVVDAVTANSVTRTITANGWAFDRDTTSPINVHIYLDGKLNKAITANGVRPDVQRAYGLSYNTVGFSTTISADPGTHTVCIYAINAGGGSNPKLNCSTTTITATLPTGHVDAVTANSVTRTITANGWAFDRDTTSPINVHIYLDGKLNKAITANGVRPDVQRAYGLSYNTVGFSTTISADPGTHTVCIYAINAGGGSNPKLNCSTTTITSNSAFNAGDIISDAVMFNPNTMTKSDIQTFLSSVNGACRPATDGTKCLKDYTLTTSTMKFPYCTTYAGTANETAAAIIAKSASACGINPRTLIVMLQKEQGLVTASAEGLSATKYNKALGLGCPDNSTGCDASKAGFQVQIYGAASRLVQYGEEPSKFNFRAGQTAQIQYHPNKSCGSSAVTIANRATAALYNYTPYQPNAAALAHMYGTGDACSSYGNRNFWRVFTDWFGSTH
jgi:hypothetical protein